MFTQKIILFLFSFYVQRTSIQQLDSLSWWANDWLLCLYRKEHFHENVIRDHDLDLWTHNLENIIVSWSWQ